MPISQEIHAADHIMRIMWHQSGGVAVAIELFDHNRDAYDAARQMLEETGKAAIIHPTGTGKSFIAFRLCEDFSEKTICWLSPSEYIFKTQLENLRAAGGEQPENIRFFTYARLMNLAQEDSVAYKLLLRIWLKLCKNR